MTQETLKKLTPRPIWRVGSTMYWWWHNRGRHAWPRLLSPQWRKSQQEIEGYRDLHRGQRCFILGNGPSLRQTDLTRLQGEMTFGLNRIYLLFEELGFSTTYLVSVNELVLEQCAQEIKALSLPKFLTWRARQEFQDDEGAIFLDTDYTGEENFTSDMTGRVFEGFTVTYVALQLAFYMGFERVILIGVDHSFKTSGPANKTVISTGDDPNHFHPDYFGKGFRWQLPDLEGSERAYRLARQAYELDKRQVLDATIGGKLAIFPKVDYHTLF